MKPVIGKGVPFCSMPTHWLTRAAMNIWVNPARPDAVPASSGLDADDACLRIGDRKTVGKGGDHHRPEQRKRRPMAGKHQDRTARQAAISARMLPIQISRSMPTRRPSRAEVKLPTMKPPDTIMNKRPYSVADWFRISIMK